MERKIEDRTILDKFAEEFCKIMDKHAKYIVCSGFVAIASGRSRGTEDIDMIIEKVSENILEKLHEDLINGGFICVQSDNPKVLLKDYLEKGDSIRYVWKDEGFFPPEMEVHFAKDSLDVEQIKERIKIPFTGLDIYFSPIDSNIAFKEQFLGTEKDIEDARHLRFVYSDKINEDNINKIKDKIKKLRQKDEG